jgi:hypothetical protein
MSIDTMLRSAVDTAARAWDDNSELRYVFGKPGSSKHALLGNGSVAALLRLMLRKKQILHFVPPKQPDNMLAHAVLDDKDYYATPGRPFAPRQTILLNTGFFSDAIRHKVTFKAATPDEKQRATTVQMRAVILLHEARHLYSARGHGVDPASHDGTWNDYILWTGFLGKKVARQVA